MKRDDVGERAGDDEGDGDDLSFFERIVAVAASGLSTLSVFGLVLAAAFGPLFILVDLGLPGAVANMLLLPSAFGAAVVARAAHRRLRRGIGRQLGARRRPMRSLQAASLDAPVAMPSAVVTDRDDDD